MNQSVISTSQINKNFFYKVGDHIKSPNFFKVCVFLVFMGFLISANNTRQQNEEAYNRQLFEILENREVAKENNKKIEELILEIATLTKKIDGLEMSNEGLKSKVCVLQQQVQSLGAEPKVSIEDGCDAIKK